MKEPKVSFTPQVIKLQENEPFVLEISNHDLKDIVYFKIKTSVKDTYQVKPSMGSIQPTSKRSVSFKLIKNLTSEQISEAQVKHKFKLEFIDVPPQFQPQSKQEFKSFWEEHKDEKKNYFSFNIPIDFGKDTLLKTVNNSEPFSPYKRPAKIQKIESMEKNLKASVKDKKPDTQLTKEFEELKKKEERLILERSSLYQPKQTTYVRSTNRERMIILIVFLCSIVVGNYLKLRVVDVEEI